MPTPPLAKENLLNYTPADASVRLRDFFQSIGQPAYRAAQVVRRLWMNPAPDFGEMTELPRSLREQLDATFELPRLQMAARQKSIDGTEKFLFTLDDGQSVETVAIPDNDRLTLCISSQAGCALRCAFCATGAMGFQRNLTPFEIAGQVRSIAIDIVRASEAGETDHGALLEAPTEELLAALPLPEAAAR